MSTNTNDASEVFERYAEGITEPEERERFARYMEAWRAKQKAARPHDESAGELRKRIEVLEAARTTGLENEGKLRMENAELRGRLRNAPSAEDAALLSVRANQIECLQKEADRLHEELESMTKDKDELQAKLDAAESDNSVLRTECTDLRGKLDASIWMALDADGVKWTLTETEFIDENGCAQTGDFVIQNGKIYLSIPCKMGLHELNKCRHVAPKPETIDDVREAVLDLIETIGSRGYRYEDGEEASSLVDNAYECGLRKGSANHE